VNGSSTEYGAPREPVVGVNRCVPVWELALERLVLTLRRQDQTGCHVTAN